MASLTLYGSNVSDANLSTASSMSTTTGGTETSSTTTVTGTNPYAEVYSRSASEASVTSAPSPSGKGWVYKPGTGTFATGNWSASITLQASAPGTTDATLRIYKYSGGTYTAVGTINKTGIVGTKTTYSFAATSMSTFSTNSTDLVYFDLIWHDLSGADDAPIVFVSNSASAGVANDFVITTSSFSTAITVSRTVPATIALLSPQNPRTVPATIALLQTSSRIVPASIALLSSQNPRTVPSTISLANEFSRIVPATIALDQPSSRTVPATIALLSPQNPRTVPATIALLSPQNPRTVPASISLAQSAVFYASNVASTISSLILSDQMSTQPGGTETSVTVTMPGSGTNSYVELLAQGGTSSGTPALPAPSGKGWSIGLSGNTILAGSWSSIFTLAKSGTSMSGASLIVRWYRRTVDGTYYPIGLATLSGQSFTTTKTIYNTPSISVVYPWQFVGGDTLYMDAFTFNGSTAWNSDIFTVYVSNSATKGVYNDAIIIAPEIIATPALLSCMVGASNFQTGNTLPIKDQSFTIADALDQRSILTLTGEDTAGNLAFQRGMPIMLSDHDQGLLYAGAVNSDKETKISADPTIAQTEHMLTFMDAHYLADKRENQTDYANWTAGDIACDFIQSTLSQEGVTGAFALESDYTPATLGAGTLSGTVATTTTSPFVYAPNTAQPPVTSNTGDLELTRAGTQFTLTEQTTSDFAIGTLTNMTATSNSLKPTTQSAIRFVAQFPLNVSAANSNAIPVSSSLIRAETFTNYASAQIWSGSQSISSSDTLNYDIWIASTSPAFMAAVDFLCSDGTTLSLSAYGVVDESTAAAGYVGIYDQNNISADFLTDLTNFAKDAWYTRNIDISSLSGKTVTNVYLKIMGSTSGIYTIYVKNCYLNSHSSSPFFSTSATTTNVNPPIVTTTGGYIPFSTTDVVQVYQPALSMRISLAHSISSVGLVQNSTITWTASLPSAGITNIVYPPGTSAPSSSSSSSPAVNIYVSYDGTSWILCTNQGALPGLPPGAKTSALSLYLMEQFQAGSDPTAIPALLQVTITINSAAAQTTTDVVAAYGNATAWNTGTYNGTTTNSSGDLVNGGTFSPIFTSSTSFNYTMRWSSNGGSFTPTLSASSGTLTISNTSDTDSSNMVLSFDDALPLTNGTIECDLSTSSSGSNQWSRAGIIYRGGNYAAGWNSGGSGNGNASQYNPVMTGYLVYIQADTVNSTMFVSLIALAPGTGTANALWTTNTTISQNTTYHLKVVFEGNRHTIYFNHATSPMIDYLDNTYTSAGRIGLYAMGTIGNSSTCDYTSKWRNFTCTPLATGTWTSPSISLASLITCGYTQISWSEQAANGAVQSTAVVVVSTDGGSTWKQCYNGAELPGMTPGASVSSLLIRIILYSNTFLTTPTIIGLYVRVCGPYGTVTGTRISPALSLSPVGYVASSNCMWNANIPTSTSLSVQTTQDLSTYHTVGSNGAGEALPYWSNQPSATQDLFSSVTSSSYTNTSKSGGSVASVTYNTPLSNITLVGGLGALYLNLSINTDDVDLFCDMDRSDTGGLVFRFVDTSNYYELGVYDASSSGGFTNQLRLYKVASGVRSLLGSASVITFTRGTFHRVRASMQGGLINVYWDGQCMQSYLDTSPLSAGAAGLRNDGGTSRYYQLWIQPLGTNLSGQVLYTKVTMSTSDPSMMPQLFTLVACIRGASIATGATISQLHPVTRPFAAYYSNEIDYLVQLSGDYYWYIDRWKQLHFGPRLARPGAFPIQSVADPAGVYSGYLLYQPQVSVLSSADLYRNRQIVTNVSSLVNPPPEIKVADGSTTSWSMGYPLYSAPTILVNGQPATVGIQGIDNNRQFYWQPQSASISYDSSLPKLPAGTVLSFTYVGTSINNVTLNNTAAQAAQAAMELNSGIVAQIESALNSTSQGMSTPQATTFGNGLLSRNGNNAAIELIGTTLYAGLTPGTVIPVFIPEILSTWNAQLPIVKMTTTGYMSTNGLVYLYSVDATNGPGLTNWSRVFYTK